MKIAFIHYHLKTGGVTTVLKHQLAAVAPPDEALVITGDPAGTSLDTAIVHLPELGYHTEGNRTFNAHDVARQVLKAVRDRFGAPCDVIHIHNPILAKNRQFLEIIKYLQNEGANLLLQVHDFAEDGRPQAYYGDEYPVDCHYGVINKRDYDILLKAGLKKTGLHRMENSVTVPSPTRQPVIEKSRALYPIRAIRRKNIGEAVLLSLFLKPGQNLAITLPPNSPADLKSYRDWKAFVQQWNLAVEFDRGLYHEFEDLVLSSEFLITTSITEGFGFSFLEPWLFGKLLWGRKIADICRYFEMNGIHLEHLYSGLYVPVDWINVFQFRGKWSACLANTCRLFNFSMEQARLNRAFEYITADGKIDFGMLDESSQKQAVSRLLSGSRGMRKLIQHNPFLSRPGVVANPEALIAVNRAAIMCRYNPEDYRTKLMKTYHQVSTTPVRHRIDRGLLVSSFLKPEAFSLLKWGGYVR
ncbi:MAG: hypothetical protein P8X90_01180 [Desulfobacterales bacterium]